MLEQEQTFVKIFLVRLVSFSPGLVVIDSISKDFKCFNLEQVLFVMCSKRLLSHCTKVFHGSSNKDQFETILSKQNSAGGRNSFFLLLVCFLSSLLLFSFFFFLFVLLLLCYYSFFISLFVFSSHFSFFFLLCFLLSWYLISYFFLSFFLSSFLFSCSLFFILSFFLPVLLFYLHYSLSLFYLCSCSQFFEIFGMVFLTLHLSGKNVTTCLLFRFICEKLILLFSNVIEHSLNFVSNIALNGF